MGKELIHCPVCGSKPDRFTVSRYLIEVIACPTGCRSHEIGQVIHVTSGQLVEGGYTDIADVWNSMEITKDEHGKLVGGFHLAPKHIREREDSTEQTKAPTGGENGNGS